MWYKGNIATRIVSLSTHSLLFNKNLEHLQIKICMCISAISPSIIHIAFTGNGKWMFVSGSGHLILSLFMTHVSTLCQNQSTNWNVWVSLAMLCSLLLFLFIFYSSLSLSSSPSCSDWSSLLSCLYCYFAQSFIMVVKVGCLVSVHSTERRGTKGRKKKQNIKILMFYYRQIVMFLFINYCIASNKVVGLSKGKSIRNKTSIDKLVFL